jgi:D-alanine-D-alanine ligase
MDVIVLCGGLSAERDVSITSGTMVAAALRRRGHRAVLVDLFFGYPNKYGDPREIFDTVYDDGIAAVSETTPDLAAVKASRAQNNNSRMGDNILEICRAADIVFLALHGEDGEDGKIQAAFDLAGIKYTGSGPLGSAIAMNKAVSKQLFLQNGIQTPPGVTVTRRDREYKNPGFPCVVKPVSRGSSVGVSVVNSPEEYGAALEVAFQYDDEAVAERYIKGRECDVGILNGKALPVIEICPKEGFYDYKNKYQKGMTDEFCPADFPPDMTLKLQSTAERVFSVLKLEVYARMDFIVDGGGGVWCLEANTLPGLTPVSLFPQEAAAAGMSYEDMCQAIIDHSLMKYEVPD